MSVETLGEEWLKLGEGKGRERKGRERKKGRREGGRGWFMKYDRSDLKRVSSVRGGTSSVLLSMVSPGPRTEPCKDRHAVDVKRVLIN